VKYEKAVDHNYTILLQYLTCLQIESLYVINVGGS